MAHLLDDLRLGVRLLIQQPGVSFTSILALAFGIGLSATMFSIVNAAQRDLPYEDADRITMLWSTNPERGIQQNSVTQHDFVEWRDRQSGFEELAAFYQGTINVAGSERPMRFEGAFMTPSAFDVIRQGAAIGRVFRESDAEPGAPPALLIGHDVWRNQFQSDPAVVGADVRVNGLPGTIIGVMPEGFRFPFDEEAWLPLQIDLASLDRGDGSELNVFGRVREGTTREAAVADVAAIAETLAAEYPETNEGTSATGMRYVRAYIDGPAMAMLWTMQGAVLLVLLIACSNVANLLLSRAIDRTREVAVRAAVGASRRRVVSQFLAEVAVLAIVGGALGLVIAQLGAAWFSNAISGIQKPFWIDVRLDLAVLGFTGAVVVLASLLAGIVPALQVSSANLSDVLKDETRGSSSLRMGRLSKALVIAEVAFACGLLVGAGLMIKSIAQLSRFDYGFPTDVFTSRIGLFEADYPDPESRRELYRELRDGLAAQPGVVAVSLADALPGSQMASMTRLGVRGESYATREDHPLVNFAVVDGAFFETFDTAVLRGRTFTAMDREDTLPVAIVNESFAARVFSGRDPLGEQIRFGTDDDSDASWLTIVGVAPDLSMDGVANFGTRPTEGVYLPIGQSDRRFMSIAVRTEREPLTMSGIVRQQVAAIDPDLPIYWVRTLQTLIDDDTWFYRVFGSLFVVFGAAAMFLATIGLYGVMAFAARRRVREVGIRMALGARGADVLGLMLRQGSWQIGVGLVLGLGLAALAGGGLQLALFDVNPRDPVVFATIAAMLAVTGLVATLLPARRASRIDPVNALRD